MQLTDGVTSVTVNVTAMQIRETRRKEMVTAPGGVEPIYIDMGREPIRVDFEAIANAEDGKQLVSWCKQGTLLQVNNPPPMFPSEISYWVLESANSEGLKGNPSKVKVRCILIEKTEYTYL